MADPFVSEIRIFGFGLTPKGWAQCNGQLLPIQQNTALFSLIGTYYGGDGKSTFALPDLRGMVPIHAGQGSGLSPYGLGETAGVPTVTLLQSEMPFHNHLLMGRAAAASTNTPSNGVLSTPSWVSGTSFGVVQAYTANAPDTQMNPQTVGVAGGSQPHNNMMPSLVLNFCIALVGVFPPRP